MTDALKQATPPPRSAVGVPPPRAAAVSIPIAGGTPRTPTTPSSRRKSPLASSNGVEPPKRTTPGQKQNGRGEGGGRGGAARSLLRGAAAVVLLMLAGIAASEINLRLSRTGSQAAQPARLSSSSFSSEAGTQYGSATAAAEREQGGSSLTGGLSGLLSSAAAAVAQQLGATGYFGGAAATAVEQEEEEDSSGVAEPSPEPGPWQLRCAVVSNLIFHIDVMAGWTYAFQTAGCNVTVYHHERSLGIEDIMSAWFTGSFRKPALFPGEAGDYHIVILPTFRDEHAELVQYLLQLPRLQKQRYFLTQHNPDWLLNHPNIDILEQQLLSPLIQQGEQAEQGGEVKPRPLRVGLATLAPCVSQYMLGFLHQLAFNLTEGQTFAERVGSFHVRGTVGGDDAESKDNSEERRQWVAKVINYDVPWLSPLVPWQPAEEPVDIGGPASAAAQQQQQDEEQQQLQDDEERPQQQQEEQGQQQQLGAAGSRRRLAAAAKKAPARAFPPPPPGPPPTPPGAEATALLEALDKKLSGLGYPRHVCIQGKLENSRRNYTAAFEAISHPGVLHHLRTSGERLLLLGHRSKWETVVIPDEVADVVVVLESLPYTLYFDTLSRCRAIMLAFATDEYYTKKSSSTIAMAINVGVPLVAERRTLEAYTFLRPESCFVYDDTIPSTAGDAGSGASPQAAAGKQQAAPKAKAAAGGGRRLEGAEAEGEEELGGSLASRRLAAGKQEAGGEGAKAQPKQAAKQQPKQQPKQQAQPKGKKAGGAALQQQAPKQQKGGQAGAQPGKGGNAAPPADPQAGSYSAAILAALRSESSIAAHQAVRALKAEVMNHNVAVAAAFMADTEGQFSAEERDADRRAWALRQQQRLRPTSLRSLTMTSQGAEVVLQVTAQSIAHRLWRYAKTPGHHFYPPGFCTEAIEVGPHDHRHGPCIVHFKGCRLTPEELNAWLRDGPASCNVVRVYWLGPAPSAAHSEAELVAGLLAAAPQDGSPLRLQCFPRSIEAGLVDQLDGGLTMQPVNPSWVLHVVRLEQEQQPAAAADEQQRQRQRQRQEGPAGEAAQPGEQQQQQQQQEVRGSHRYLYSLQPAAQLYQHAHERGKRVPDQLSKAAGKLAEALVVAGVQLTSGVAVDLGAAPGGWTRVLAAAAQHVIAVDPAALDERALLPNVTHLACKAQDAVPRIRELAGERGIGLLVSDMNRHPLQLADMLRPLLPLLHPGGAVILTLKYYGRSCARNDTWRQQLAEQLGPEFPADRALVLQLLANTEREQTFVAFKAGSPGSGDASAAAAEGAAPS
ncbi:cell division [Chlorella sorokiniana]|uniref:Cell division n=1 Tax=Chlorella sorokiniana TaxID=3076 RepID=A0A2P6TRZ1_CHLSO|nr:cell division [Chlorella sorokiniana]|eukprot:PRW56831.1 cell division [Chlorella sorokiniana]